MSATTTTCARVARSRSRERAFVDARGRRRRDARADVERASGIRDRRASRRARAM